MKKLIQFLIGKTLYFIETAAYMSIAYANDRQISAVSAPKNTLEALKDMLEENGSSTQRNAEEAIQLGGNWT